MVFNVAAANCDDHTKNVSFLLPQNGSWQLAPAYDVTHAHAPGSRWTRQHLMAVNGRSTDITRADVDEVADRFEVPSAAGIVERVLDVVAGWPSYAARAQVPPDSVDEVADHIATWSTPLQRPSRSLSVSR
jgi:serine/threonine-protein kinase HipA